MSIQLEIEINGLNKIIYEWRRSVRASELLPEIRRHGKVSLKPLCENGYHCNFQQTETRHIGRISSDTNMLEWIKNHEHLAIIHIGYHFVFSKRILPSYAVRSYRGFSTPPVHPSSFRTHLAKKLTGLLIVRNSIPCSIMYPYWPKLPILLS